MIECGMYDTKKFAKDSTNTFKPPRNYFKKLKEIVDHFDIGIESEELKA